MSLISPLAVDFMEPRRFARQLMGLSPHDFIKSFGAPFFGDNFRCPWKNLAIDSSLKQDEDKFQVCVDVQHFAPDEITVKTADGFLIIEGKHEERQDEHGFVSRSFVRKYSLPEGVKPELLVSKLSSDGVLTVSAPLNSPKQVDEKVVPIIMTGPVKKEIDADLKQVEEKKEETAEKEKKGEKGKKEEKKGKK